jgi:chromosome segregation ATPase
VRPAAEREGTYATLLDNLKRAEEALRSRDRVLAADQDAQTARLASVDAQLLKLEAELVQSQAEERALLAEMGAAQGALSRAEAKVKRAETELRAAQRAPNRTSG